MRLVFIVFILGSVLSCVHRFPFDLSGKPPSVLNKKIRDITFWPLNSLSFRLSELKEKKGFVLVMREKDCPISEKYGGRLKEMEEEYSKKGIQFIYVYVGQVRPHEMARADLKNFGFKSPYVVDLKQRIINILSAETTGDVFVLTPERKVIYRGPLDDQYYVLKKRIKAKKHYVRDVLGGLLKGKELKPRELPAPGCIISRPVLPEVVFWKDVSLIIRNKCTSCHNPKSIGPMDFMRYEDVAGRGRMFEYVVKNDLMPPWHVADNLETKFKGDLSLGVKEKAMLLKWARQGFKKGKDFKDEALWEREKEREKIQPDYVIQLPEKVIIPKEGWLYKHFLYDPKLKKDKWIKYIKFNMKPKVIHHAILFIMKSDFRRNQLSNLHDYTVNEIGFGGSSFKQSQDKHLTVRIPAKHKLLVQIHYEAQGKEITDDYSHIQIKFHKKKPEHEKIHLAQRLKSEIRIPPHESHYHIKKSVKIKNPIKRLNVIFPHMHLRGKRVSLYLMDSKGNRKRLFGLDPWSILFERGYTLKTSLHIPKESVLEYHYLYDNSSNNVSNPNPNKEVLFGLDKTESEMGMIKLMHQIPLSSSINF